MSLNTKSMNLAVAVGGGAVSNAANLGAGDGVFAQLNGSILEFKSLVAGPNITLTPSATEIEIDTGAGVGEANTSSNVGAGEGLALAKVGVDLPFKSILGETGKIIVTGNANDITLTIDAAYVGQASISTIGTIESGVWNGSAIFGDFIDAASTDLTDSASLARDTDNLSFFSATTSAQLAGVISDETGSGALVFGTSPTLVTPAIASFVNATHDHTGGIGGGQLLSTNALSDTDSIAYLNTANLYTTGMKQTVRHDATNAGLRVVPNSMNPSTLQDGDIWINSTTQQIFARINGVSVDLGVA